MKSGVLILGGTGLLGNAVVGHFQRTGYDVVATYRDRSAVFWDKGIRFDVLEDSLDILPDDCEYVLNCIGVIKPFMAADPEAAIRINSLFPWRLAQWCEQRGAKLIHITTDCVYSGQKGKYVESDSHDALDAYGKTKSLGECADRAMLLRTSIIGEEIHKHASLVAWAKSRKGQTVSGFTSHLWNGITTNRYAAVCDQIIREGLFKKGLFHIFARDDVSKFTLLHYCNEHFDLGLTIEEAAPGAVDRTLRSEKNLCAELNIPEVAEMVREL